MTVFPRDAKPFIEMLKSFLQIKGGMSPYVPTTGSGVPSVEIPEGEWLVRRTSPGDALFVNLLIFSALVSVLFGLLLVFSIVLMEVLHFAIFLKSDITYVFLISIMLSIPVYLRFFSIYRSLTVSTKVSKDWSGTAAESSVYMALHECGVSFKEKEDDDNNYMGKVFFNRRIKISIYVSREEGYTLIGLEGSSGKGESLIFSLVKAISRNMGISSKLVPIENLLKRRRELLWAGNGNA